MRALPALLALVLSTAAAHGAGAPTVALVIDDLGHNDRRARRVLALPPPIAVAVLPQSPYAEWIARTAVHADIELLVHLPMQGQPNAHDHVQLRTGMAPERFRQEVRRQIRSVPGAIGVNNHMGSILTTDHAAMQLLMSELKRANHPLVFLDSRTTADTVAEATAIEVGIDTAARDVFLDHDRDAAEIERQIGRWLSKAHATGCALAIGHPHPETLAALERLLPHITGVRRVGLREYIQVCGAPAQGIEPPQVAATSSRPENAGAE